MKIVIDIPESYLDIQSILVSQMVIDKVWDAVKEGTPLDDIKTEIENTKIDIDLDFGNETIYNNAINDVLEIIDKYMNGEEK